MIPAKKAAILIFMIERQSRRGWAAQNSAKEEESVLVLGRGRGREAERERERGAGSGE